MRDGGEGWEGALPPFVKKVVEYTSSNCYDLALNARSMSSERLAFRSQTVIALRLLVSSQR